MTTPAIVKVGEKYQYVDSWEIADAQLDQASAGYNPLGASATAGCANCTWFLSPGRCVVVSGDISPTGVSDLWRPKADRPVIPIPVTIVPAAKADSSAAGSSWLDRTMAAVKSAIVGVSGGGQSALPGPVHSDEPPPKQFQVLRQKDGRMRFFTLWSNNFTDREGEIFTEAAHKEFVEWADETGKYPELWLWHTPGSRIGQVDWLDVTDGFVGASGLIDSDKESIAEKLVEGGKEVGASHGYVGLQAENTILMYRTHEISALPLEYAAVPTTSFTTFTKETEVPFTPAKRKFFSDAGIDDAQITVLETQATNMAKALKAAGTQFKADDLGLEPEPAPAAVETPVVAAVDNKAAEANAVVLASVVQSMGILTQAVADVAASVKAIDERTKSIVKSDDQRVAEALTPSTVVVAAPTAGSKATDNIVSAEKAGPDMGWFGEKFLVPLGVPAATTAQ